MLWKRPDWFWKIGLGAINAMLLLSEDYLNIL